MASTALDGQHMTDLVREANHARVKVSVLPSLVDALGPSTEVDDLEGVTLLGLNPVRFSRSSWAMKRTLDVLVSFSALLLALPLLPFVALAIKLDSKGPVFFGQDRRGRRDRPFRVFKLRTMGTDAEAQRPRCGRVSAHSAWLLLDHDPRVTRVGRVPAQDELDELPQLWNVLRGEMSLVGPRPLLARRGCADRRLGPTPARPDAGNHRPVAGVRPHDDPIRRDDQARLPVRDELESVGRHQAAAADRVRRDEPPRCELIPRSPTRAPRILMLLGNTRYETDTRVLAEAVSLVAAGYEVVVVAQGRAGRRQTETIDGVVVRRFREPPEATSFVGHILETIWVTVACLGLAIRVALRQRVDAVHVHNPPDTLALVAALFKLAGRPVVFDHHDLAPELYGANTADGGRAIVRRALMGLEWLSAGSRIAS